MQTNINKWPNILLSSACKIIQLLPNHSVEIYGFFCHYEFLRFLDTISKLGLPMDQFEIFYEENNWSGDEKSTSHVEFV